MSAVMGIRRLLLLAFAACVLLDLGCPFVPGAFSFDPAESVDAVSAYRARPPALPRVASAPPAMTPPVLPAHVPAQATETPASPSPARWRPHARRDHVAAADPRPSVEDD
jgi:hypothetical protein